MTTPLDYLTPNAEPPRRRRRSALLFAVGLFSGVVFSFAYFLLVVNTKLKNSNWAPTGFIAQGVLGVTLVCFRRWRALGVGLITVVPVAVLIFVGICFFK